MHIRKLETDGWGGIHLVKHHAANFEKDVSDTNGLQGSDEAKGEDRGKLSAPRAYFRL
jgi:hypothetical protein